MFGDITRAITGFLKHNNNPLGLGMLGLSAMIEYVFPPFPGDTVTLFGALLVTRYNWSVVQIFAVVLLGSGIGAMIDFYVGVWMGRRYHDGSFPRNVALRAQIERVLDAFRRHGAIYVSINRFLPAVRAMFFIAAGVAGLRAAPVLFYALVSAAAWNALIIAVGYAVGANWRRIKSLFRTYSIIAWSALGAVAVALLVRWIVRRRRTRPPDDPPPPAAGVR
jgi:membrane protein DedA with SNARE-associated domain